MASDAGTADELEPQRQDLLFRRSRATCVGVAEPAMKRRPPERITVRHARRCGASDGSSCRCQPAYQAPRHRLAERLGRHLRTSSQHPLTVRPGQCLIRGI